MAPRLPRRRLTFVVSAALVGLGGPGAVVGADGPKAAGKVDYNYAVRPILSDRCFLCHGPDERSRKAGLRLDQAASAVESGAVVPGNIEESELVRRISLPESDKEHMPPKSSNLSLSKGEVDTLRRWVGEGAEFKPHWAFLPPPATVTPPAVSDPGWPRTTPDAFILAALDREGLKPSPPASREAWIRRVSFDLNGLPPTPAEVDAFLADTSAHAFETVVDRLLASPRYGERMAGEWLDLARYADSFGYQADGDTNVWPWRDWVIGAFNANLSYDQFLTHQIAGDRLPNADRNTRLASAFNRLHRMTNEGGSIAEEWRNEYVSDRVHTFGTAVLGLTMECTRCHDHKYDPLSMKDYYSLGAFFNNIDEWGTYDSAGFRPSPTVSLPTPDQERTIAALKAELVAKENALTAVSAACEPAYRDWVKRGDLKPEIPGLAGYYPLDKADGETLENLADRERPAKSPTANPLMAGHTGLALSFSGDDAAEFPAAPKKVERSEPFAVSFRLKAPASTLARSIVFHREAGTDTGFHGAELTLEAGRLQFALVRFWPGNALAVRTKAPLAADTWAGITLSYDGSGRASGVRFYRDGVPDPVEVVRDGLTKNVEAGGPGFSFGARFRSVGLKDGLIDEIRQYSRALTPLEVAQALDGQSLARALDTHDPETAGLRVYYQDAVDPEISQARAALHKTRGALFDAETAVFDVMAMDEMPTLRPVYILARGAYDSPKTKPVGRETPAALPPFPADAPRDRLGLARWFTDPNHPLTARVAVNRYWQLFFGRGLVATTENFGVQGALPTHPELLDALAREFISTGWDVKALCKRLVLSSTYRQQSSASAELRERDPDNKWLARGPSQRLPAEMLRDAALAASGLLAESVGGPPVRPAQPPGLWRGQNAFLPEYVPDTGKNAYRRSLYTFWRRTSPPPNMLAFDAPSREVCVVRRQSTSTPLQPLVLLNDPQFVEAAVALGARMLRDGGTDDASRVVLAFRLASTRQPTEAERSVLAGLLARQRETFRAEPTQATRFLGTGGVKGADPVEHAAASVVAGVILNLDAAVTVR